MSPILVRPVREQLEHDRVIRLLQARYKRKSEVGINPGNQQAFPVGIAPNAWYPDLVLQSTERSHKLVGIVEVETAESVNNLEAMSQWGAFSKLRVPFHLYVPQSMIDPARRLCQDLQISVSEIWMYHMLGDQMRFTLVQRSQGSEPKPRAAAAAPRPAAATARPAAATARPAAAPVRPAAAPVRPAAATARPRASTSARAAAPAARTSRVAPARPARRAAAAPARKAKPAAKSKAARPAARPVARKKTSGSSRSQKRK